MKLSVGMYVRYISGFHHNVQDKPIVLIGKILSVDDYINLDTFFGGGVYPTEDFKKLIKVEPSFNLIDLIGLGDYVNGYPVYEIIEYEDNTRTIVIGDDNKSIIWEESSQYIKSIVTKEQMEAIQYKVVEE